MAYVYIIYIHTYIHIYIYIDVRIVRTYNLYLSDMYENVKNYPNKSYFCHFLSTTAAARSGRFMLVDDAM